MAAQLLGIGAGVAADALIGDPRRWHPVAGFGYAAAWLERRTYAPDRAAGARFAGIAVGVPVAVAVAAHLATRHRPWSRAALAAATTWAVLGGTSLRRQAYAMAGELERGDLVAARARVPNLCGRDPAALDAGEIARATVESVAENTSDAQVAPLVWGVALGLPGLVGYRAINTLDAMIGHRSPRYTHFGTAAARMDDVANLLPSRLSALLTVAAAGSWQRSASALVSWLRDGGKHPSPNSGQCEAAMAGALGVRLGGRNVYHGRVEVRPALGRGRRPAPADVRRAARISGLVGMGAFAMCAGARLAASWATRTSRFR
jgi:adenosylcobinamide-phosphate synthase